MNIDACRIGDNPGYKYNADRNGTTFHGKQGERIKQSAEKKGSQFIESTKGRWPANLLLDEEAAAQLDAQTGTLTSGKPSGRRKGTSGDSGIYGSDANRTGSVLTGYGDTGGASRFFYCAKATKKERGEGNDHPTVKPLALMDYLLTLLSTPDRRRGPRSLRRQRFDPRGCKALGASASASNWTFITATSPSHASTPHHTNGNRKDQARLRGPAAVACIKVPADDRAARWPHLLHQVAFLAEGRDQGHEGLEVARLSRKRTRSRYGRSRTASGTTSSLR